MAEDTEREGAAAPPDGAASDEGATSAPGKPSPLPPTAEALAGKARDLEALCDAVVDAASVGAGLWFSYLCAPASLVLCSG